MSVHIFDRSRRGFASSVAATAAIVLSVATFASAQQVSLTIRDGRVTLKTENASVRQILDEWTRVGQTKVVNAEKVTGPPLTLTLVDVPEREALETVMRSAAGYAVVERNTAANTPAGANGTSMAALGASRFEKILVMARTTPVSQTAAASAPAAYVPPAPMMDTVADEPVTIDNEPPQPVAPVVNPYAANAPSLNGANPGTVYPGVNSGSMGANGPSVQSPETKFDYANPQAYFDRQRQQQQQQSQSSTGINPYPGSGYVPPAATTQQPQQPSNVPSAGTTMSQPGISPVPQTQPQGNPNPYNMGGSGGGFNPYNMNPYNMPPSTTTTPPATPVEPDRAKYANPYVPTKPQP
jgi:hypothetical protein